MYSNQETKPNPKPKKYPKTKEDLIERLISQDLLTPLSKYHQILLDLNSKLDLGLTETELSEFKAMIELRKNSQDSPFVGLDISFGKSFQDDWCMAIKCLFSATEEHLGFKENISGFRPSEIALKTDKVCKRKIDLIDLDFLVGHLQVLSKEDDISCFGISTIWWLVFNIRICDKLGLGIFDGLAKGIAIADVIVSNSYVPYIFGNGKTLYITMVYPNDAPQRVLILKVL